MIKNIFKLCSLLLLALPSWSCAAKCLSTSVDDLHPLKLSLGYTLLSEEELAKIRLNVPEEIGGVRFPAATIRVLGEGSGKTLVDIPVLGYAVPFNGSRTYEFQIGFDLLSNTVIDLNSSDSNVKENICIRLSDRVLGD